VSRAPLDLSFSEQDHIVRAGAGAGKTFNLVACVYESFKHFRALDSEQMPRFVLTTFTRKATQELRERMVLKACELEDQEFFQFVTEPGYLTISTIHGVLGQFLKEFGHLFQMDLSFQILEGQEEKDLLEHLAREWIVENSEQFHWMEEFGRNRLVAMLKSFHYQYGKNAELRPPSFDEAWSHTQKYIESLRDELRSLVEEGMKGLEDEPYMKALQDLHGFLEVWDLDIELELPPLPRKTKRESFPVQLHEQLQEKIKKFKAHVNELITDPGMLEGLVDQWTSFYDFALGFSQKVRSHKEAQGMVTLSDLENQVAEILEKSPYLGKIFSENFEFWLVDEFQDTSSQQLKILNHLIGNRPRFVVGDPQQSIYLFRGAEAQIFMEEWERISSTQGRNSLLEVNYRSQGSLLQFFNEVMSPFDQFSGMEAHHPDLFDGAVATFLEGEDEEDELRGIYTRVLELCGEHRKWDEICVLGRTHEDLFQVATYLKNKGVPTHVHSPSGFLTRREVQDALSLYKFLINPHDNLNLLQVLRSPWLKVEDQILVDWMSERSKSLWMQVESLESPPSPIETLKSARKQSLELGLLRSFMNLMEDIQFIEHSSSFDPSGRVEANIWKLVGQLKELEKRPGSHPLDILNSIGDESDAVAATEPNCVNLMTIHGSKGLEFDHVIFPRLGKRFQLSKRGIMAFSSDGRRFVFSQKDEDDGALVCTMEKAWIEDQRIREREEVERWFYVALTRARLTVSMSWSRNQLYDSSWVDLFALKEFKNDRCQRREGPFEERDSVEIQQNFGDPRSPFQDLQVDVDAHGRESFSQMKSKKDQSWSYQGLKRKYESQAMGIHWHRVFEALKFSDGSALSEDQDFLMGLDSPPLVEILENGHVEWGFQAKEGGRILEGQIDLWGIDGENRLWVIDYKTGSSKSSEQAIAQVKFYLWILRKKGLTPSEFKWSVIYPFEEKVLEGSMSDQDFKDLEIEFGFAQ